MKLKTFYGEAPHCEVCGPDSTCVPKYWTLVLDDGFEVSFEICEAWRDEKNDPTTEVYEDGSYWKEGATYWVE